jgi:hypothetical protein
VFAVLFLRRGEGAALRPPFGLTIAPAYIWLTFEEPTNPKILFFFTFFLVRFWAFLGEGSSKTRLKKKMQKVHVKNFFRENSQKIDKNFDVTFSSTFFVLSRFQVFLSDGSSQTLQKTFYKKIVSKSFYKKIDKKIPKPVVSRFFLSRFWAFLGEGSSKTR